MNITFNLIKDFFGSADKNINQLVLQLAVKYGDISYKDIFQIFKLTCENYLSKSDEIVDSLALFNQRYAGKTMLQIKNLQKNTNPKDNYHSTYIFRNLYRVINESEEWDIQLKKKNCIKHFIHYKEKLSDEIQKTYRNNRLLDLYEITCEFIDLISNKNK